MSPHLHSSTQTNMASTTSKLKHPSATEADLAVGDRMPEEGVSGPVVLFHNEKDLPLGFCSNFFPAPIIIAGSDYITSEHYFQCGKALNRALLLSLSPRRMRTVGGRANSIGGDEASWLEGADLPDFFAYRRSACCRSTFPRRPSLSRNSSTAFLVSLGSSLLLEFWERSRRPVYPDRRR